MDVSIQMEPSSPLNVSWTNISCQVKDKNSRQSKLLLQDVSGIILPGEMVALMGSSGSGKTTLLNILARRLNGVGVKGDFLVDGRPIDSMQLSNISAYVEQEDALIGSLTVFESVDYTARLSFPSNFPPKERISRVHEVLATLGLSSVSNSRIGTPLQRGISGGQKRRVSLAIQLVTLPKILFLDEPTSGLDSVASFEVISSVQKMAMRHHMMIIISIHQPSSTTFNLFDRVLLLSRGRQIFFGPTNEVPSYFLEIGYPLPPNHSPAEFMLDVTNMDFIQDQTVASSQLSQMVESWKASSQHSHLLSNLEGLAGVSISDHSSPRGLSRRAEVQFFKQSFILSDRLFKKSRRDVLAYGVRVAMYLALAFLMGTVWLRLSTRQEDIQIAINSLFFASAFLSFMTVAYIPSFLEDFASFKREASNGLYSVGAFIVSNTMVGVPYLFLISFLFSAVAYPLIGMRPDASGFFNYIFYLFLDLLAAESLVVLICSVTPIFVVALTLTAFANGLWMVVGGFLVPPASLNSFWYYTFYWIDYQRYTFESLLFNEVGQRTYSCGASCHCMYPTRLESQCLVAGDEVVSSLGFGGSQVGLRIGILIAIIVGLRLLTFGWLLFRQRRQKN